LRALQERPLEFFPRLARQYGDAVGFRAGPRRVALFVHPEAIEDILVGQDRSFTKGRALQRAKRVLGEGLLTSEGAHHLRQRRLAQPAFHRDRIASYGASMVALAEARAESWQASDRIDVAREMNGLTLAIVARTLFGADVDDRSHDVREALTTVIEMFDLQASPLREWLDRLPLPHVRRFRAAQARLDAVIYRLIAERRSRRDVAAGDLLSLLLAARDEEADGRGMTDRQLRDEAITVFLAGHETTANALAWTWWLLAGHPEVARRWRDELAAVLQGRLPAAGDVARLPFTRMIVAESMRLYPPAWIIGRRAIEDVDIQGFLVRRGTIVLASQWVTQRDPRFFPDPDVFRPARWEETAPPRPRYAYFPFGGGSRVCIGETFAWMEAILVLATIGQRWRLARVDPGPVPMLPKITLRPKGPLWMRVDAR
jgi:cytochrome P450